MDSPDDILKALQKADAAATAGDASAANDARLLARMYHQASQAPAEPAQGGLTGALEHKPGWTYGSVLPLARGPEGGLHMSLPDMIREPILSALKSGNKLEHGEVPQVNDYMPAVLATVGAGIRAPTKAVPEVVRAPRVATPPPPTTAALKTAGDAGYKAVAQTPVTVTPQMGDALGGQAGRVAIQRALDGAEANRETDLVAELKSLLPDEKGKANLPTTISANAAEKVRQAFGREARAEYRKESGDDNVARGLFGRQKDVGAALDQVPELKDARATWAKYEKSQIIDETIQAAKDTPNTPAGAGDLNQALRKEFGKLIRSNDFDNFSPPEQDAIKKVANGTFTANALQRLGKFSPVRGHLTGLLELLATTGGAAAGGAEGAMLPIAIATGGEAARQGAILATKRNANLASELVRRGGPAPERATLRSLGSLNLPPRALNNGTRANTGTALSAFLSPPAEANRQRR